MNPRLFPATVKTFLLLLLLEAGLSLGWFAFLPSPWYAGTLAFLGALYLGAAMLSAVLVGAGAAIFGRLPGLAACRQTGLLPALAFLAPLTFVVKSNFGAPNERLHLIPFSLLLLAPLAAGLSRLARLLPARRPDHAREPLTAAFFVIAAGVGLNKLDPASIFDPGSLLTTTLIAIAGALLYLILRPSAVAGMPSARSFVAVPAAAVLVAGLAHWIRAEPASAPQTSTRSRRTASTPRPNVLLVLVDTLRADGPDEPGARVSAGESGFTRLERDGTRFLDATSPSSYTMASVASLISGFHPRRIDAFTNGLARAPTTLARILKGAGYRTGAFIDNPVVTGPGFRDGYERLVCRDDVLLLLAHSPYKLFLRRPIANRAIRAFHASDRGAPTLVGWLLEWIREDDRRPFFGYLHLMDPHSPYYGEESVFQTVASGAWLRHDIDFASMLDERGRRFERAAFSQARERYRAEVRRVDGAVGRLARELEALGLWDQTLVVLVSDHGEEFGEHGFFGHGHSVYQELVHVPLFVKWPRSAGVEPGRVAEAVSSLDVFPTLLEAVGLPEEARTSDGQTLLPLARGEPRAPRPTFSEASDLPVLEGIRTWKYREGRRAVIVRQDRAKGPADVVSVSVADVGGDETPGTTDLGDGPLVERAFRFYAALWGSRASIPQEMSEEVRAKLRALGYVR
jgi:arylsulfatase A-like enzyme